MTSAAATPLLLLTTLFWGVTFVLVKEAIAVAGVAVFLAQRFLAAFAALALIAGVRRGLPDRATLARGAVLGAALLVVYVTQTEGLRLTSATNAAFITGLGVVLVPVVGAAVLRQRVGAPLWGAVALATAGLALLTTGGRWDATLNRGDLLAAACAVGVAAHLLLTGRYAPGSDVSWLAATQVGVVALGCLALAAARGEPVAVWHPDLVWPLAFCALLATAFAFLALTAAQRVLSPTHTAVIVCMEPVFAAAWARVAAGERLATAGYAGAALILAGMLVAEVAAARRAGSAPPPGCRRRPG